MIQLEAMPGTDKSLIKIMALDRMTDMALTAGWQESGKLVVNELVRILTTGPRTGRVYTIRGKKHQASAPGEPPAKLTGRLAKSAGYRAVGPEYMQVGEEAFYAGWLEQGTSRMAERPHLRVAVDRTSTDVMNTLIRYLNEIYR